MIESSITLQPIGILHTPFNERYLAPLQAEQDSGERSTIELFAQQNFETALRDIEGFERIWVVWYFHEAASWRPIIQTPRDGSKHGVFATRSPHRPNPIAISAVQLCNVEGRVLTIGGADMLDLSPVLDIKPYIPLYDSFPDSTTGWLDAVTAREQCIITWSEKAREQARWIDSNTDYNLSQLIERRLTLNPLPTSSNRIEQIDELHFCLSSRAWQIYFSLIDNSIIQSSTPAGLQPVINIDSIASAYSPESEGLIQRDLSGREADAHLAFVKLY